MRVLCAVAALCVLAAAAPPALDNDVKSVHLPTPADSLPFPTTTLVSDACQRRSLNVSLADSWDSGVIAPKMYDAGYCSGSCPASDRTPYATILARVHLEKLLEAPKPCCDPTEFKPISVLYFDKDYNIIYDLVKDMIVTKCGCR